MILIKLFVLGVIGYLLSGLYDIAVLYRKTMVKWIFYPGFFITAIPYLWLFLEFRSPLPIWVGIPLLIVMSVCMILLIYSVLIEIQIHPVQPKKVYDRGTYRISRHPGFLWYTLVNVLIALYFWDMSIALVCLAFIGCNLLLIIVEDFIIFPKMFSDYGEYKQQTPFLFSLRHLFHRRDRK